MSIEAIKKLEFAYQTMEAASQRIDELKAENAALRQAIEQAQKQEPVGEVQNERGDVDWISFVPDVGTSLYTSPPQRQPLTDEQWQEIANLTGCLRIEKRGRDAIMRIFDESAHGIKREA
jgi:FtsZ-binding cell division protein ZapB